MAQVIADPRMKTIMTVAGIFDGKRPVYGGFKTMIEA